MCLYIWKSHKSCRFWRHFLKLAAVTPQLLFNIVNSYVNTCVTFAAKYLIYQSKTKQKRILSHVFTWTNFFTTRHHDTWILRAEGWHRLQQDDTQSIHSFHIRTKERGSKSGSSRYCFGVRFCAVYGKISRIWHSYTHSLNNPLSH